jgi:sugar O-acyltransferase (sialic acid O-acetyltransferase NeuD family)
MIIAIVGVGGQGQTVEDCLTSYGDPAHRIFYDDKTELKVNYLYENPKLSEWWSVVAIGDNVIRNIICEKILFLGGSLLTVKHKDCFVSDTAKIGVGSTIHFGAHVGANVVLGKGCIVNNGASVGHGCKLGDYVNVCDGTMFGGDVTVGDETFIGLNCTILPKVKIGKACTIGAGSVVINNIPDGMKVAGNPARPI